MGSGRAIGAMREGLKKTEATLRVPASALDSGGLAVFIAFFQQPVKMRDEIAGLGGINRSLGFGFPCGKGRGIVREKPDDMHRGRVHELRGGGRNQLSAKDEVKALGHIVILFS
jgi:hypothetical protein